MKDIAKKLAIILLVLSPILISAVILSKNSNGNREFTEKVYVTLEEEGRVAVVDSEDRKLIRIINLSDEQNGKFVSYEAHNVQVSPDGSKVLVTANVNRGGMGADKEGEEDLSDGFQDKLFIMDPITDTIIGSVQLGIDLHLAHVVSNRAGSVAYINAQETGKVFVVDLDAKTVLSEFDLGENSGPHGLRIAPDDSMLFIALLDGQAMASVDLQTGGISKYPLSGKVVQTAVSPNGEYAFASVYDTKQVAWVHIKTGKQDYINLPAGAMGPVQLYPSPDSQFLYVADQGFYFDQPTSNKVYRINIADKKIDQTINAGSAPHGIVIDKLGKFAYVSNLIGKNISVIDLTTGKEIKQVSVGKTPNGISVWNKETGGTP